MVNTWSTHGQHMVNDNPLVDFVFSDVNCSLCVHLKNGKFEYFSNEKQFENIWHKLN